MSAPASSSRRPATRILVVCAVAFLSSLAIGIFVPSAWTMPWMLIAFGACVLLSFVAEMRAGRTEGFIARVAGASLAALLVMGIVTVGFAAAALFVP